MSAYQPIPRGEINLGKALCRDTVPAVEIPPQMMPYYGTDYFTLSAHHVIVGVVRVDDGDGRICMTLLRDLPPGECKDGTGMIRTFSTEGARAIGEKLIFLADAQERAAKEASEALLGRIGANLSPAPAVDERAHPMWRTRPSRLAAMIETRGFWAPAIDRVAAAAGIGLVSMMVLRVAVAVIGHHL